MSIDESDSFTAFHPLDPTMDEAITSYLNAEELPLSDDEDPIDPAVAEHQNKYNQLNEKYISLKAMAESLKEKIALEKEEWGKELKVIKDMEAQHIRHDCVEEHNALCHHYSSSANLQNIMMKNKYQHLLWEVENKCDFELMKIRESMSILKPLRDVVSRWEDEREYDKIKHLTEEDSGVVLVEDNCDSTPVKDEVLEIDEN